MIRSFAYNAARAELSIIFTTGRRYLYAGVPPTAAEALAAAFSKGRHFNAHIRDRYSYREVDADG